MAEETATSWPQHAPRSERRERGKAAREALPLKALAEMGLPSPDRDPVALVGATDGARLDWLVPIRYGRMLRTPFTFFRGSAALMAHDLAQVPRSDLQAQLCGDAHLLNFGLYGSPERALVFDLNDFDETLRGPFEWDVKRLVASLVVAARDRGFKPKYQQRIALAAAERYRTAMREFSDLSALETWYAHVDVDRRLSELGDHELAAYAAHVADRARGKDHLQAAARFTEVVDGRRRIITDPPLIEPLRQLAHIVGDDVEAFVRFAYLQYHDSVRSDVRVLLDRYTFVDAALKVVGVGSVGTLCAIVLMQGADESDLLFLQVKQAMPSVLETYLAESPYEHHGQRVVVGQRLMQAASDPFLGWATGMRGRHYYWRQLRDWKGSVDVDRMSEAMLERYGMICGWLLAKAHARTGDPIALAAYMGSSARFETAIAAYATAYADRVELDHAALEAAVVDGRISAEDDAEARG